MLVHPLEFLAIVIKKMSDILSQTYKQFSNADFSKDRDLFHDIMSFAGDIFVQNKPQKTLKINNLVSTNNKHGITIVNVIPTAIENEH